MYDAVAVGTGSRWLGHPTKRNQQGDVDAIRYQLQRLPKKTLVFHGDCQPRFDREAQVWIPGADQIIDWVARGLGFDVVKCPADWDGLGRSAGPVRNCGMVDAAVELKGAPDVLRVCIGFPLPDGRGTQQCMHYAKLSGLLVREWWSL